MSDYLGFGYEPQQLRLFDPGPPSYPFIESEIGGSGGILGLCTTAKVNSTPLTSEDLYAAFEAVTSNVDYHPCKLGRHLVSATGKEQLKRGGRAICHECGSVLGPYSSI